DGIRIKPDVGAENVELMTTTEPRSEGSKLVHQIAICGRILHAIAPRVAVGHRCQANDRCVRRLHLSHTGWQVFEAIDAVVRYTSPAVEAHLSCECPRRFVAKGYVVGEPQSVPDEEPAELMLQRTGTDVEKVALCARQPGQHHP